MGRLFQKVSEPGERIVAVLFLGPEARGCDDNDALLGKPLAGKALGTGTDIAWQRRRMTQIEPQLHGRRNLVDVLPAGARRADKGLLDLARGNGDLVCDLDHGGTLGLDSMRGHCHVN